MHKEELLFRVAHLKSWFVLGVNVNVCKYFPFTIAVDRPFKGVYFWSVACLQRELTLNLITVSKAFHSLL